MSQDRVVQQHFQRMGQDGSYAAFYSEPSELTHDFFARRDRVQEFLSPRLRFGQTVLDVGCGTGPMAEFFASRGLHYHGLDTAQSMLDSLWQQHRDAPYAQRIRLDVGSCERLPYADESFDFLVAMGLLEYLDDMQPTLREIARVVRPGCLAVLTIPNYVSLNRFMMRNGSFVTSVYHFGRRLAGAADEKGSEFVHHELAPRTLDDLMRGVGFEAVGRAFYDYKFVCYPLSRLFPRFAYSINRRLENKAPSFLANGYIGFYQKQAARAKPQSS